MQQYPHYNSPKEINLEDFIDPKTVVETGVSGLVVQENKIYPKYPIYVDYNCYNWEWTRNEDTDSPNKWLRINSASQPVESGGIETYAPIRIWLKGTITEDKAIVPGTRDSVSYLGSRLRDLTPYMKNDRIDLGIITADRVPHSVEFVVRENIIHTNYDFGNDPESVKSLMIVYTTLTPNVKLKVVMRTNDKRRSEYTPTLDSYILKISGQSGAKELIV